MHRTPAAGSAREAEGIATYDWILAAGASCQK